MELEGISTKDLYKKKLFYVFNYIIYGVKAWINKMKKNINQFYGTKSRGGLNANISKYLAIKYTTEAYICVKIAYYVRN